MPATHWAHAVCPEPLAVYVPATHSPHAPPVKYWPATHGVLQTLAAPSYTCEPVQTQVVLSDDRLEPAGHAVHASLLPSPHEFAGHATHPDMSAAGTQYVFDGQHRASPPVVHCWEPEGHVTEPHEMHVDGDHAPTAAEYVPWAHAVHALFPATDKYVPAPHEVHVLAPAAL